MDWKSTALIVALALGYGTGTCALAIGLLRRPRRGPSCPYTFDYDHWPRELYRALCYGGAVCLAISAVSFVYGMMGLVFNLFKSLSQPGNTDNTRFYWAAVWAEISFAGFWCGALTNGKLPRSSGGPDDRRLILYLHGGFLVVLPAIFFLVSHPVSVSPGLLVITALSIILLLAVVIIMRR